MTLADWHDRLADHFSDVHARRPEGRPVFALEHGLSADEVAALSAAVRDRVRVAAPTARHRLPLVIYAAEFGYRFEGTEYWPSFEDETPGWAAHGDRAWLRRAFQAFHADHRGARPTGPWAEHFSIIAWPITHAVLPADLQRHLVRALWGLRTALRVLDTDDPTQIGQHVRAAATGASNRFLSFCEQPALVGQIALALFEEPDASASLLEPALVDRLVAGVRRRSEDGALFEEVRRAARLGLRGLRSGRGGGRPPTGDGTVGDAPFSTDPTPRSLGLDVDLELRPRTGRDGRETWDLVLRLPGLRPLVTHRPELHDALDQAWLDVEGSGRSLAPGSLLQGRQVVVLDTLPDASRPLLRLDTENARLGHLVGTLRLAATDHRLFRIAADGAAREVRGRAVRPGQSYILVTTEDPPRIDGTTLVSLTCTGAAASRFMVPDAADTSWGEALEPYGIHVRSTVSLWPAGVPPTLWDGAGTAEWLVTDPVAVGVSADAPIELLELTLNGSDALHFDGLTPGEPTYVSLGPLRPGVHRLTATAMLANGTLAEGELEVRVRQPALWQPAESPVSPLRVRTEPPAPSIRDLLSGAATVEAYGPQGVKARLGFRFVDRDGRSIGTDVLTGRADLPITQDQWHEALDRYVVSAPKELARAHRSVSVRVTVDGGALGSTTIRFDRVDEPLRWDRHDGRIRLLDDRDDQRPLEVEALWATQPLAAVGVDAADALDGFAVGAGGVLTARDGVHVAAVLVTPTAGGSQDALRALRPACDFEDIGRTPEAVGRSLAALERWADADRVGSGGADRILRRHVLKEGARALATLLSPNWSHAEDRAYQAGRSGLDDLAAAIPARSSPPGWRRHLPTAPALAPASLRDRTSRLAALGRALGALPDRGPTAVRRAERGPDHPRWLAELALRLASAPHTVRPWSGDHLAAGLAHVLGHPHLLRAARYVVLAAASGAVESDDDLVLYPSWSWPSRS